MKPQPKKVETVMRKLARAIDDHDLPAVEKIAEESQEDPFEVLISTMLSAQTRDPVTAAASAGAGSSVASIGATASAAPLIRQKFMHMCFLPSAILS